MRHVALIMNAHKPYDRQIMAGIARYVRARGQWSLYVEDDPSTKVPHFASWNGDGLIVDFDDMKVTRALHEVDLPVVAVGGGRGGWSPESQIPYVITDNAAIAGQAADHLLERGFRHFAYVGMPRTPFNPWSKAREDAFARRVAEAGFRCARFTGRHRSPRQWEALQQQLTEWLAQQPRPLGLMASNDARARHVLEACRRVGLRVPEDVAVIGVDNDELMCELANPPLTSVIQATQRIGEEASQMLDRMMNGEGVEQQVVTIPPLGIATRQSTDILAVEDDKVSEAIGMIRDRACDPIQVSDVLARASLSRATLEARFKRVLGRTIHAEIQRVQIETAAKLLATTDLPIKEISERVGFKYVQYLTTVFRRATGHTPAAYRRRSRH